MSDKSLDLFQGKWGELDQSVATQARDALQKIVDLWKAKGERECRAKTTVLLTVIEMDGTTSSRLSTNHDSVDDIREALDEAVTAELAPEEPGPTRQVGGIWGERLAAEYGPILEEELELLTVIVLGPLLRMNYKNSPIPLIETLALKQEGEVSEKDIEDGFTMLKAALDPLVLAIVTQLGETRERIERALREHPQIGFHADN